MKTYKYWTITCLAALVATFSWAQQGDKKLDITYTAGIPLGNLKNLTDNISWRGLEGSFLYGVSDQVSAGLQIGYQDFYQKYPRQVFHESGYDLSAVVSQSIQVMPVLVKGRYRFASEGTVEPYASLAVGGNIIDYQKYYGQFVDQKTTFGFAAQPEIGIRSPVGPTRRSGFHLAAGYNYMPFKYNDADGLSHAVIKVGFSFGVSD